MMGDWRMFCQPQEGEAFSYGLVIKAIDEVDEETLTFTGSSTIHPNPNPHGQTFNWT